MNLAAFPKCFMDELCVTRTMSVFNWIDLVILGGIVLTQPFTEWLIHVYVLHVRPRGAVSRAVDWGAGRSHRLHHRDPGDLSFVQLALAGVDADPHLDPDGADRVQDGFRATDRAGRDSGCIAGSHRRRAGC